MRVPLVVLLHGLARSQLSMRGLARHLQAQGFATWNYTWPSRRMGIEASAAAVAQQLMAHCGAATVADLQQKHAICAVTHSLGGVVALQLARQIALDRAVLLAPPLQGSKVARFARDFKLFHWYYGPAGAEVAVPPADWHPPGEVGALGIIAGTSGAHWSNPVSWATRALGVLQPDEPHDGTVAAHETRPPVDHHYAEVPAAHTFIMDDPQVRALVVKFLRSGRFEAG